MRHTQKGTDCTANMNIDFHGKTALVTGAGKGIGRCIALKLASLGAKVYALSRTEDDLVSLKAENPSIETRCLDLGDWYNTRSVVENLGPIDLLVNNAAYLSINSWLDVTEEEIEMQFNVNFKAALNVSQVVAKGIISRGGSGAIVNISSLAGLFAFPHISVYCTTKAALDMLTKSMACELAKQKIRVNSCNPTGLLTPMGKKLFDTQEKVDAFSSRIPMGRFAEPEEVANTTAFLLSDYASMITGALVPVDGGQIIHLATSV